MNRNKSKQTKPLIRGMIIALLIGIAFTAILMLIFAYIMMKQDIPAEKLCYFWFAAVFVINFITGFAAAKNSRIRGFWAGLASSAIFSAILICVLIGSSKFDFNYSVLLLLPIGSAGGILGGIAAANTR